MTDLTLLPNIGPVLANRLQQAGVKTWDELKELGSVEALGRIRTNDSTSCYNTLYALEGAIRGVRWHTIPLEDRQKIKVEFDQKQSV